MDLAESTILILTIMAMALSTLVAFVPFIPGPVLVWGIGCAYAAFTALEQVTFLAVVAMTAIMIVGSTADFWMQVVGMKLRGGSCLASLGSVTGGFLATFIIPVPICGTVIGMVLGALAFEMLRHRELDPAIQAGQNALSVYLLSALTEFGAGLLIVVIFLLSLWYTA